MWLYSSKRCFTHPLLLTRQSALVLKVGVVQMASHLKEDCFIVLHSQLCQFCTAVKSFSAIMHKCKSRLKSKFKCVCVAMCSLVMSSFSREFIKTKRLIKVSAED